MQERIDFDNAATTLFRRNSLMIDTFDVALPGLDCGLCGYRTCDELKGRLVNSPEMLKRCIHLSQNRVKATDSPATSPQIAAGIAPSATQSASRPGSLPIVAGMPATPWQDSLGREFDFYLEHFPEDPGPREIILPHNPLITRELEIRRGDILIGRPLGMSCGCPITHCGIAMDVDSRTGVIVWCVTGPLGPRQHGFKDLGYYIAEGYEGLVHEARCELKVGIRYYFQPRMCMLQWRHSGLVNYLNRMPAGCQVRLEGLWIG
jgi:uncharacterized Fe-S cluster-containing protein